MPADTEAAEKVEKINHQLACLLVFDFIRTAGEVELLFLGQTISRLHDRGDLTITHVGQFVATYVSFRTANPQGTAGTQSSN